MVLFVFVPEIDNCESLPCQNGGQCINAVGTYNCVCVTGYTGYNCESMNYWTQIKHALLSTEFIYIIVLALLIVMYLLLT